MTTLTDQATLDGLIADARFAVRVAELRISTSVLGLPLREQVADTERLRAAQDELHAVLELVAE